MSNYPLSTKNYELLHLVGCGTYSRVYEANCRDNNQVIAIKQINLDEFPLELETIQRQTAFWSKCDHPNVVQYYGSFVEGSTLSILNEFMGAGSLKDIIKYGYPNGFKDESLIAALLAQIITGIKFFHDNHEIHRDIRSNNILVNSEGFVKLGDFGLATSLVKGGTRQGSTLSLFGEECYMAPEVLRNENGYSEKTDIWSLGLTAIELGTGKMPYAGMKFMESLVQIIDHDPPSLPDGKEYSSAYRDFIKQCLCSDPAKRATAGDLLNHRFLKQYINPGLPSANLLNNKTNEEPLSAAAAYIKKQLASQLPPLCTIFKQLHQDKESISASISKTPSQMVFDFSSVEKENDKGSDDQTEKAKSKNEREHKHHRKHGHKQKRRHHKEKKDENNNSDEDGDEKKTIQKRKSKSKTSDSDYSEKEEESSNTSTDSESKSYSDSESKDAKKKSKKSKKKRDTKNDSSNSDDDDDVAYDNDSSTESDEYGEKSKRKERKSKRRKNKKKHRKTKDDTNDDQTTSQKEEKKDVQKMGRFSVTRTESNQILQNSSPKVTASVSRTQPNSSNSSLQLQSSSQSNLDQQQRIEALANEISSLSAELTRLENENVSLKKRLEEVVVTVNELQSAK